MAERGTAGNLGAALLGIPGRWIIALLAGAAGAFAFAPFYLGPLLFLALPVLFLLVHQSEGPRAAFALGWWFGVGHFSAGLYWVAVSFTNQPATADALGPPAVLLVATAMALYPALATMLSRKVHAKGVAGLLFFAVMWAAAEWARGHAFTGFPWNPTAAIWAGLPSMMQPLALIGTYGLGLLTTVIALMPALMVPPFGHPRRWVWPLCAAIFLLAAAGYGNWRLKTHPRDYVEGITLRLVQANIPQLKKWDDRLQREHFANYLALSNMLGEVEGRLIVLWPETAVTDYFFDRRTGRRAIVAHMLPTDGLLITGAPRIIDQENGMPMIANSLFAIDDLGHIVAAYDKSHLLPFAEFLPMRGILSWLGFDKLTPGNLDFTAGNGPEVFAIDGFPTFTPLICYEAVFPGGIAGTDRPDFFLNITNDAWFGDTAGPFQHFAMARMRAVEEGVPLVRVAQTGISAVIDPMGRITAQIPHLSRGTVDANLPRRLDKQTLYARFGDLIFSFFLIALALPAIFPRIENSAFPRWSRSK